MKTLETTIHQYRFNTDNDAEKEAHRELCTKLRATPNRGHLMNALSDPSSSSRCKLDGPISVDASHLFDNQWNETTSEDGSRNGWRVFDWYEAVFPHSLIKAGHYLDITQEMIDIRKETLKCGYCGKQEPESSGLVFCPHCLGSEYLTEGDLRLTSMRSIDDSAAISPLTDTELDYLMPLYIEAQIEGDTRRKEARFKGWRAHVSERFKEAEKDLGRAKEERDAMTWLLDRQFFPLDNVIYYTHLPQFCFGWRNPLDKETVSRLLDIISEFPYPYKIRQANGPDLEGY